MTCGLLISYCRGRNDQINGRNVPEIVNVLTMTGQKYKTELTIDMGVRATLVLPLYTKNNTSKYSYIMVGDKKNHIPINIHTISMQEHKYHPHACKEYTRVRRASFLFNLLFFTYFPFFYVRIFPVCCFAFFSFSPNFEYVIFSLRRLCLFRLQFSYFSQFVGAFLFFSLSFLFFRPLFYPINITFLVCLSEL